MNAGFSGARRRSETAHWMQTVSWSRTSAQKSAIDLLSVFAVSDDLADCIGTVNSNDKGKTIELKYTLY